MTNPGDHSHYYQSHVSDLSARKMEQIIYIALQAADPSHASIPESRQQQRPVVRVPSRGSVNEHHRQEVAALTIQLAWRKVWYGMVWYIIVYQSYVRFPHI